MGMHSFELSSSSLSFELFPLWTVSLCSFECFFFKFCMKVASAGALRGGINWLTIEMGMSSILGKCITA